MDVPLVIHGGSGLASEAVRALIAEGVALFHVGTVMKKRFWEAAAGAVSTRAGPPDYQALVGSRKSSDFLLPSKAAVSESVRPFLRLYGSSGKAE